jgi:hypothetical protein
MREELEHMEECMNSAADKKACVQDVMNHYSYNGFSNKEAIEEEEKVMLWTSLVH